MQPINNAMEAHTHTQRNSMRERNYNALRVAKEHENYLRDKRTPADV